MALQAGIAQGNEQRAGEIARAEGISNPSSGIIRYLAYGAQDYGFGEAQQYGLPISPSKAQSEFQSQFQEAIKPAVQSYEASIPEIGQKYATERTRLGGEKQPLTEKYQNLVAELTGRETKETEARARALSGLYSQRGIPLESPAYQQDLERKLTDISQFYGGQRKDVGLAKEADIRDIDSLISQLTGQEVESVRSVRNAIAQLQATGGLQANQNALDLYKTQQAQQFESRFDPLQRQLLEKQLSASSRDTEIVTVGGRKKLVDRQTGAVISDLGSSAEGTTTNLSDLAEILGFDLTTKDNKNPYSTFQEETQSNRRGGYSSPGGIGLG